MPKAKTGNFTLRKIVAGCPADKAAHRYMALQRSGQYSELRMIQRGKNKIDIIGYRWPDKGVRRKLGIGKAAKNPIDRFTDAQIRLLHESYDKIKGVDTGYLPTFRKIFAKASDAAIIQLAKADIKFVTPLAYNELHRRGIDWRTIDAKNPKQKGATTPNQVRFGLRGKTLVGWINRETPTTYEITYKVGAQTRTVIRKKNKVQFMRTGKKGRIPNNCPKTANGPAAEVIAASEMFHGLPARFKPHKEWFDWPKLMPLIGPCTMIEYVSDKFDGKVRKYYHEFGKGCRVYFDPKPQKNGEQILIIRGPFTIKPEGITG